MKCTLRTDAGNKYEIAVWMLSDISSFNFVFLREELSLYLLKSFVIKNFMNDDLLRLFTFSMKETEKMV